MRAIRLIAVSDEFDTSPGLVVKGTTMLDGMAADRDGLLVAHDLLEHQNGAANIGPVWDELEALDAIWQVRGRHGDLATGKPNDHSPAANVASDVSRMFRDWLNTDGAYCGPLAGRVGIRPHLYDDDFREILELARHDIVKEAEYEAQHGEEETGLEHLETYLTFALQRMRVGFRKAEKRFGDHFYGHTIFCAVRDAVERAIKYDLEFEGQEFTLRYGNGEASCSPVYGEEYE